jgi:hypothetical protein
MQHKMLFSVRHASADPVVPVAADSGGADGLQQPQVGTSGTSTVPSELITVFNVCRRHECLDLLFFDIKKNIGAKHVPFFYTHTHIM